MLCFSFTRVRKAKLAISWYFFVIGTCFGNLAAIMPFVKENHNLNNGLLGGVLASAVAGALCSLPVVTYWSERFGCGNSTICGSLCLILLFSIVGVNSNIGILILGVFFVGFGAGWSDVSVNGQAVLCEKMTRTPILGMFHSIAAMGGLFGALVGGLVMENGISVLHELAFLCFLLILPGFIFSFWLFSLQEEKLINQSSLLNFQHSYDKLETHDTINPIPSNFISSAPAATSIPSSTTSNTIRGSVPLSKAIYDYSDDDSSIQSNSAYPVTCSGGGLIYSDASGLSHGFNSGSLSQNTSRQNTLHGQNNLSDLNNSISHNAVREHDSMDSRQTDWQVYNKNSTDGLVDYTTLVQLCALCFIAYFSEGSVGDWSAVFLKDTLHASPIECSFGYVGFSFFVALGRWYSDCLVLYLGRPLLLKLSGIVGCLGLVITVISPVFSGHIGLSMAIVGFAICGAGTSVVSPSVISLAGSGIRGMTPSSSIAYVSSIGYVGIMVGPPLLGGLSLIVHGLRWSFLLVAFTLACVSVIAFFIQDVVINADNMSTRNSEVRKSESRQSEGALSRGSGSFLSRDRLVEEGN